MQTFTLFELLEDGEVVYQDQERGVVISKLSSTPIVLFKMWKHVGDGNFEMWGEISRDDLFSSWIDLVEKKQA